MGNRAEISFVFKNCIVMLCEGLADNAFFQRLCENRSLPKFDFPFPNEIRNDKGKALSGKDSFGKMLKCIEPIQALNPTLHGILIATDCGDDAQKAFEHAAQQVKETGFYPCPEKPNEIIRPNKNSEHMPPLALMLIPGAGKAGALETLCVAFLRKSQEKNARCLDQYFACLDQNGKGIDGWGAEKRGKAEMQCLIATTNRDDPNKSGRFAIEAGLIDVCDQVFDEIATALNQICAAFKNNAHSTA